MKRIYIAIISYFTILVVAGLLCSTYARAETTVGVHILTHHFKEKGKKHWTDPQEHFNNYNYGLYVVHNGWTAGAFHNSDYRASVYAGYTYQTQQWNRLSAGLTVGLITGYRDGFRPYPMVVPSVAWHHGYLGNSSTLRLMFMARTSENGSAAIHLSHEWKF